MTSEEWYAAIMLAIIIGWMFFATAPSGLNLNLGGLS
jgi:hypothetical protein